MHSPLPLFKPVGLIRDRVLVSGVLVPVKCTYRQACTAPGHLQACHYYGCSQHTPDPTPIYSTQAARQQYVPCQGSRQLHSAPQNQKECKTGSRARPRRGPFLGQQQPQTLTGNGKQRQQQLAVCLLVLPGVAGMHRPPRRSRKQQPRGARAFTGRACSSGETGARWPTASVQPGARRDGAYLE